MRLLVSPSQYWVRRRGIARYPLCSGVCEMPKGVAIRKGQPPTVEPDLRNRSLYSSYLMVPTSAFSGRRTLCDVRSNALFDAIFISLLNMPIPLAGPLRGSLGNQC